MPKVSFVVPVYNGDTFLAETLESIRNQSLKDIEIVVVDDCSPDYTVDLMEWYVGGKYYIQTTFDKDGIAHEDEVPWNETGDIVGKKHCEDGRIIYRRLVDNVGVCKARNYGNSLAKSDIICVSDQDDLSMKHRALYSYYYLRKHPEVDCLTSAYYNCNVDGQILEKITPVDMTKEVFEKGEFTWFHSSCCYRKNDILALPYRVVDGETDDWVFLKDWTAAGKRFKTLKKVMGSCRRVPWGQMSQRRQRIGAPANYVL